MLLIHFVKTTVVDHFDSIYFHVTEIVSLFVTGRMTHSIDTVVKLSRGRVAACFCVLSLKNNIVHRERLVPSLTSVLKAPSNQGKLLVSRTESTELQCGSGEWLNS